MSSILRSKSKGILNSTPKPRGRFPKTPTIAPYPASPTTGPSPRFATSMSVGQVDLQPHYQREYVWELKPELPSRLVESLILEIPVPPIYFGKMPGGRLEVIDGQQRLTTLIRFVRNEFHLQKLQRMGSLNGKQFRELSEEHQAKVMDAPIRSIVIDAGNNQNLRYEVFERLNRGAMGLNEQELRNCVYRGPFCDLIAELEMDTTWRRIRGETNQSLDSSSGK